MTDAESSDTSSSESVLSRSELSVLLDEVKWGEPSGRAIDEVAAALASGRVEPGGVYTAVHILGRAARASDEALIALFLDGRAGPMTARVALQGLCSSFGRAEEYREQLLEFVNWVPWDDHDDVRLVAVSAAGELLRGSWDRAIWGALERTARDMAELTLTRTAALMALARAMGDEWSMLPDATVASVPDEWRAEVLGRAARFPEA